MSFFNFFFKIQNMLSLVAATLLFCMYSEKRKFFFARLIPTCIIAIALSSLLWETVKTADIDGEWRNIGILACSVFNSAELFCICIFCFKCKINEATIYVIGGWGAQHLSGMVSSVTARLLNIQVNYFDYGWEYFVITVISYIEVYVVIWLLFRHVRKNGTVQTSKRIIIPAVIMFCVVTVLNIYMPYDSTLRGFLVMRCYAMACCVIMLFLIFGAFKEGRLNYDLNVIQQLERQRTEQYAMARASVDVINNKCHDLKKLLNILTENKHKISDGEIAAISDELEVYDAIIKTGNVPFDTILTEKSLFCSRNKIKLSVIADARLLEFMSDLDIYSLFGNILDNAIEATQKLDEELRIINMTVRKASEFVSIHAENCFAGDLKFKNGMPITTKNDKIEHGYGVYSIRQIAKKYGGDISLSADDGMFMLDILLPIGNGNENGNVAD